jgi:hypothetical protein
MRGIAGVSTTAASLAVGAEREEAAATSPVADAELTRESSPDSTVVERVIVFEVDLADGDPRR